MGKITEITWNWQAGLMESNGDRIDAYPEIFKSAKVNEEGVIGIEKYPGHRDAYNIHYDNGYILRIYNPNTILIKSESE
jgi:hypothetical protein